MAKTERMYASALLDGETKLAAAASFALALDNLDSIAAAEGREALFDTLEVSIERTKISLGTIVEPGLASGYTTITVSAEAVRK